MRSDWVQSTIDEVCILVTDGAHNSPKSVDDGEYMASVKDFTEYGFDFSGCRRISEKDYLILEKQGCVPKIGDILVGKDGARYFEDIIIYRQDERPALLSSIAILRVDKSKITPEFLYYTLKSPIVKKDVRDNYGSGSAIPRIVLKDFKRMPILYPSLDEQRRITSLCELIDKKIQINKRINENLLQQAQALYKSWFVDYDPFDGIRPADWLSGTIDDLAKEVVCGKTPSTKVKEYYGSDVPFITIPDMHKNIYAVTTERYLSTYGSNSQVKKMLPPNSICVSCIGTAGLVTLVASKSQTNQQINSIIPKDEYSPFYIYLLMQTLSEVINKLGQSGSTIVNLNKAQFGKIQVMLPSVADMKAFDEIVSPLFALMLKNQRENLHLSSVRETLLPKLMSGELDVSNIDL